MASMEILVSLNYLVSDVAVTFYNDYQIIKNAARYVHVCLKLGIQRKKPIHYSELLYR